VYDEPSPLKTKEGGVEENTIVVNLLSTACSGMLATNPPTRVMAIPVTTAGGMERKDRRSSVTERFPNPSNRFRKRSEISPQCSSNLSTDPNLLCSCLVYVLALGHVILKGLFCKCQHFFVKR